MSLIGNLDYDRGQVRVIRVIFWNSVFRFMLCIRLLCGSSH